ncbi:glucosamine-6-phosphate isomerase [Clostridium sp. AN503]|uniref:glucosamine-6-phosphate isomerase n=1 Tax=Clostridium sp. AN503 TaxID=3160598 RepID=UPI0034588A2C
MDFKLKREQIEDWCRIPARQLMDRDDLNMELHVEKTKAETMEYIGNLMADEVIQNNKMGRVTRWILPAGPMEEYNTFIRRVNGERISLKNLYVFHMDEFLDWEGRPYPVELAYRSLKGTMLHGFYNRIDGELNVPEEQRIWPDINDIDAFDRQIEKAGGIDTIWAGIGCKGLVAFCEAPHSRYYRITEEQFKNSRTRIREINEDTLVALAEREAGGFYDAIPPMAVTIGMKSILSARRAVYMITTGSWKNTVIRIMLLNREVTLEYPVTFMVKHIPEQILCCDERTLDHPLAHPAALW